MRAALLAVVVMGLLVGCGAWAAGSAADSDLIVEVSDDAPQGTAILDLALGQTLEFQIKTNPTTGYDWQIAGLNDRLLELLSEQYRTEGPGVGAGGTRFLTYRAKQAGTCEIVMTHCRPWDCANTTLSVFRARVNVR